MKPARYPIWIAKKNWTLRELTFLVKGFEPDRNAFGTISIQRDPALKVVEDLYTELYEIAQRDARLLTTDPHDLSQPMVRPEPIDKLFLLAWITEIGIVDLPGELASLVHSPGSQTDQSKWPYTYDTKLLRICRWVIETYWEGRDPDSAPSRDAIILELMNEHGISKSAAVAIDHVCRHDSLKRVGIKKRRQVRP